MSGKPGAVHSFGSAFIAHHQWRLGWLRANERHLLRDQRTDTVTLVHPISGRPGIRLVHIPTDFGDTVTVEYRTRATGTRGYDDAVPQRGVLMHTWRAGEGYVLDVNANNSPADSGSAIARGESFRDTLTGTTIRVLEADAERAVVEFARLVPFRVLLPVALRRTFTGASFRDTLRSEGSTGARWLTPPTPAWIRFDTTTGVLRVNDAPTGTHRIPIRLVRGADTARADYVLEVDPRPSFIGGDRRTFARNVPVTSGDTLTRHADGTLDRRGGWRADMVTELRWFVAGTNTPGDAPRGLGFRFAPRARTGPDTVSSILRVAGVPVLDTIMDAEIGWRYPDIGVSLTRRVRIRVIQSLLAITGDTIRRYLSGRPVVDTLVATGGRRLADWRPHWRITSGTLPAGLTLSGDGVLSGSSTDTTTRAVTVQVSLPEDTATRVLRVAVQRPVVIATRRWRDSLLVRDVVSDTLRATSLTGAVTWRILEGALPDGIVLAAQSGLLSGTVRSAGSWTTRVEARSEGGDADTVTVATRTVRLPLLATLQHDMAELIEGDSLAFRLSVTGGDIAPTEIRWQHSIPGDSLRLLPDSTSIRGLLRGDGARRLVVLARRGADSTQAVLEWSVRPLVDSVTVSVTSLSFGDTSAVSTTLASRRPVTSRFRPASSPPNWATIDSTGLRQWRADFVGRDTVRLLVTVRRTSGYERELPVVLELRTSPPIIDGTAVFDALLLQQPDRLGIRQTRWLDLVGNRNGRMDLGDVRAWLVREGRVPRSATTAQVVDALRKPSDSMTNEGGVTP